MYTYHIVLNKCWYLCSLELRPPFLYGGGSGFETGICVEFSAQIHSLARNKERGQEAVQQLQGEGLSPEFLPLDVDNEESIQAAREEVQRKYGHIDVLINNAGVLFRVRYFQISMLYVVQL